MVSLMFQKCCDGDNCFSHTPQSTTAIGDRPISRVPSSCFAMANLSPFQRGFGSLQIFSINQQVPTGPKSDFKLTSLRQDELTANSPGVFQEFPLEENKLDSDQDDSWVPGKRLPGKYFRRIVRLKVVTILANQLICFFDKI